MDILDILRLNLLSPMVLAFVLGIISVVVKGELKIPEQVYTIISIYLLFAIGLKGGFDLAASSESLTSVGSTVIVTMIIGALIPIWSFYLLRRFSDFTDADAVSLAIHFGAVSAVTLSACITFLNEAGESFEGFMPTMYVIMEIPAVIVGLMFANQYLSKAKNQDGSEPRNRSLLTVLQSALTGKSFLLLGGGVIIGMVSGDAGYNAVSPFFVDLFSGFLTLFLLEMGTRVGKRLDDLPELGWFLVGFSIVMPILHGALGVWLGSLAGLSVGGAMILGTLAASASYITAPAVVEQNVEGAQVHIALTASLVLTFPFNLTLGLPLYYNMAQWFVGT
ncbi:MAG: sodium-dependent bicarbonate transport family permease [Chloroflexota bacterium]